MHLRSALAGAAAIASALLATVAPASAAPTSPPPRPGHALVLERPLSGEAAIEALGDRLPDVAARNRTTVADLTALLRRDPSFWVDPSGRLLVRDTHLPAPAPAGTTQAAPFPDSQTFLLHSKPGAQRTIYLDFNGPAVSGTAWNDFDGVSTGPQPKFDLDGDPSTWSQGEHDAIQGVWQRVAEDFAPFDVDVTTQGPGLRALHRSDASDAVYGTRVLITPSTQAASAICGGGGCGGVAYIGIFDRPGDNTYYHPAWVFSHMLANNTKYIAEAASHEAGHNLGLVHDGSSSLVYYPGHRNWAPIMGVGYDKPLVQWNRGEYSGSDNPQDDTTVMQSFGLPLRADDHGSTVGSARALGTAASASGIVETRTDRDVFAISRTCSGNATVALRTAPTSPNLDARLRLLDASGAVLAQNDPASGQSSFDVATGLSASVTAALAPGTYYVEVDGVGILNPSTGYSDYGSLGQYSLTISPCPTDANLLANPSFEVDANADTRPDGWTASARFARSSTFAFAGTFSGRHQAADNSTHRIAQTVPRMTAGASYAFTGRVRIPATTDAFSYSIQIRWMNATNGVLRLDTVRTYRAATSGWNSASATTVAPAGTVAAVVVLVASDLNATVYVDDLALRRQ